jgi:hypothetical protein
VNLRTRFSCVFASPSLRREILNLSKKPIVQSEKLKAKS